MTALQSGKNNPNVFPYCREGDVRAVAERKHRYLFGSLSLSFHGAEQVIWLNLIVVS